MRGLGSMMRASWKGGPTELRFDVVAGLTAAAVVLPKAMAYATVAGLPVAVGLYTAFVPSVIYGLLGVYYLFEHLPSPSSAAPSG